jgi:hypothetical protein
MSIGLKNRDADFNCEVVIPMNQRLTPEEYEKIPPQIEINSPPD